MHPILALQRQIGNRAVTRLLSRRSDEDSMKDLDAQMTNIHPDADHVARNLSQYTWDRKGFEEVGKLYKSSHEEKEMAPPMQAMQARLDPEGEEKVRGAIPR